VNTKQAEDFVECLREYVEAVITARNPGSDCGDAVRLRSLGDDITAILTGSAAAEDEADQCMRMAEIVHNIPGGYQEIADYLEERARKLRSGGS